MICVRCGYCCIMMDVAIIDDTAEEGSSWKPGGTPCKHLRYSEGVATCVIHEEERFHDTPCDRHDQLGEPEERCRIGVALNEGRIPMLPAMVRAIKELEKEK